MGRPKAIPTYRKHRQSKQAIVTLTSPSGRRKDVLLGAYGSAASRHEYTRVLAEWEANGQRLEARQLASDLTVNEMLLEFSTHVESYYRRPDGTPTSEVSNYRYSLRTLRELYGHTLAAEFGPLKLKAARNAMIQAGAARKEINKHIGRIKRAFGWAVSEELIPPTNYHALQSVKGLEEGRTEAKERPPVLPVSDEDVQKALTKMNRFTAGMVRVQRLTGMRPNETCIMRRCDLDMTGDVWTYTPEKHKTQHHGKRRAVGIGPQAQAILKTFFTPNIDDYLFSPKRMKEELYAEMRANRKTPVQPSQRNRRKAKPRKEPGSHYTPASYSRAVTKACRESGAAHWHPNQLRHTFATEIRRRFGLEAAQVGLGHSRADVTQIYAERDSQLAAQIAAQVG